MKIEQLLNEHKKGVKAKIYNKKPKALVGPEALKAKQKTTPPKTELEKHSKLKSKLQEDADFEFDMKLAKILKQRGYKGPIKLEQLGMKWINAIGDIVDIDDGIMVKGSDPEYDSWVAYVYEMGRYAYGAEEGYQTGNAKSVERDTRLEQDVTETSVQDKLHKRHQEQRKKSGLPDPDYYKELKSTYDLPDEERQAKASELKKKYNVKEETDMKEAKQPEAPKPRNFVAKNAKTVGAGKHKDEKKASKEVRGQKHKNKEMAETYDQARTARIRYALMLKEGDWDQQSDEMTPPEYEMDPEELKALRNTEFSDEEKLQAMIKLAAGGTSDEEIAKIFDMDKEMVAGILDDYIEDIEAATDQDADVKEAEMGKIIDYKPGLTATLNTGPGMTTILDLKKNPTSLSKDPATGKLKLVGPQAQGTPAQQSTQQSTIKTGDAVEIGKTTEDLLRLAGLR